MTWLTVAIIVVASVSWTDTNSDEDATVIYREVAGTYQQVGQVGPDIVDWSEGVSTSEGAQLCYKLKAVRDGEMSRESNEACATVPVSQPEPPPCRQKGKSGNCK